jgi:drug/metabolite transporter (DMT)-like permease
MTATAGRVRERAGGNIAVIKVSNQGIPPLHAVSFRGIVASLVLGGFLLLTGQPLIHRDRRLIHGLILALLFALDFLFTYWGTAYTSASRAVIFLYTQPLWTALGAHFLLAGDRLSPMRSIGLIIAFGGMASVFFADPGADLSGYWVGDLMEVAAALAWAGTTLYLKVALSEGEMNEVSLLFYQVLFSLPLLITVALVVEPGARFSLTGEVVAAFAFQTIVPTASYLVWFAMIHRFRVSQLAAFTLLAPPFGVLAAAAMLGESVGLPLLLGLGLITVGIYAVMAPPSHLSPRAE